MKLIIFQIEFISKQIKYKYPNIDPTKKMSVKKIFLAFDLCIYALRSRRELLIICSDLFIGIEF